MWVNERCDPLSRPEAAVRFFLTHISCNIHHVTKCGALSYGSVVWGKSPAPVIFTQNLINSAMNQSQVKIVYKIHVCIFPLDPGTVQEILWKTKDIEKGAWTLGCGLRKRGLHSQLLPIMSPVQSTLVFQWITCKQIKRRQCRKLFIVPEKRIYLLVFLF